MEMNPKDIPNLEDLSVVTEQGMFGDLELRDPNVRKLKKKDKKHLREDEESED